VSLEVEGVTVIDNPFMQRLLTILRDKNTDQETFRQVLHRVGEYMGYEICRYLNSYAIDIETPLGRARGVEIPDLKRTVLISIMRASLPLTEGLLEIFSSAKVGFVVAKRREANDGISSIDTEVYYVNVPNTEGKIVILADPMLATGSTIMRVLPRVLNHGKPVKTILITLISSKYGLTKIKHEFPSVEIFTVAIDPTLNEQGFIIPGLGDAGDRSFSRA